MAEHRNVLAILVYNSLPVPDKVDFADVMMGGRGCLQRYWQDNAAGVVAIDRFELAGPYQVDLPALSKPYGPEAPREKTIEIARQAAARAGIDLGRFDTTIVVLHPAVYIDPANNSFGYDVGAIGNTCLLPFTETGTYFEHELGHALGFAHSHGILTTAGDWDGAVGGWVSMPVYGDPYGMMSAQTFGGANPRMTIGTPFPGYPNATTVGPMLARAELFHNKPTQMNEAGLVVHLDESGPNSATVYTAGTGAPGRPELAVYRTAGAGTVFVELRKPGAETDRNWWDGGLELGLDDELDAPGVVVHCLTNPSEGPTVTYAARVVMPGPDADATFDTPDGRFTLRVQDSQQPLSDQVTFTLRRGAAGPSVMVREEATDNSDLVSSELRTHPRFPDRQFHWEIRDVTHTVTYTPVVIGVGVGWPETTTDKRFNTQVIWSTDTLVSLTGSGNSQGLNWSLDDATSVITLRSVGTSPVSVPVHATAYDISAAGQQTPVASSSTTFDGPGRVEGWGADFYEYLASRLGELVRHSVPVFGSDDEVDRLVAEIKDTFQILRDDRPDLAQQFDLDVRRRQQQLLARPDLATQLQAGIPDLTIPGGGGFQL